jgi:iron complex outermembrane receptor protein
MKKFLTGVALTTLALTVGGVAQAQDAPASTDAQADEAQASDDGEIVVVAQRRAERLQDVPIAITALSGEDLGKANVTNMLELTKSVPGFTFNRSSYAAQPTMRGVATRNASNGDEASVATYVDGVYQAKPFALFIDLADVDSVQVLKGPQGTLFGRNAMGGAVLIETRKPSVEAASVSADASYGNYNAFRGHLYINVPIAENVALNVSGVRMSDGGYTKDIINDRMVGKRDAYNVRGKLRFEFDATTTLTLGSYYTYDRNDAFVVNNSLNGNNSIRRTNPALAIATAPYTFAGDAPVHATTWAFGANYQFVHDFTGVSFTAIGSYQFGRQDFLTDSDRSQLPSFTSNADFHDRALSQEFLLNSTGASPFKWTVGAYFFWANDKSLNNLVAPSTSLLFNTLKDNTQALFGEVTYEVTPGLFLTAGGRFNHETRDFDAHQRLPTVVDVRAKVTYDSFVPRAIIRYELSNDVSVYGSYSQGFKSGIFNAGGVSTVPVKPEKLTAYELGLKSNLFDRHVQFNVAAYRYRYTDMQVSTVLPNLTSLLQNAASANIQGVDADLTWHATPDLNFRGGFAYVDATYKDYPGATGYTPIVTATGLGGNTSFVFNAAGKRLSRTPEYTVNLGADYTVPVGSGEVRIAGDALFSDGYYFDLNNRMRQPAYSLFNANISYHAANDAWWVMAYGDNLSDVVRYGSVVASARGDTLSYLRPRSYGVRVGVNF